MSINWLPWGKEAFEKAKKENKPIIMDIFGTWCHWCHKIDKDTYENEHVAKIINEKFIAIRVDTDKRPDINERYNQGGWPTTVFLTPDGDIITGGTYIPPHRMISLLMNVENYYRKNKGTATEIEVLEELKAFLSFSDTEISEQIISDVVDELFAYFDVEYGGFGSPKFPMPDALEFALHMYKKTNDKKLLRMVEKTLVGMLGIFDNVEGGFFRYSVTDDWKTPHYEKILETNARLIEIYMQAYQTTKNDKWRKVAEAAISYVLINLSNGKDRFYGSQDADGEEEYYGKNEEGRKSMEKPLVDKTVYTNLNALMIYSMIEAAEILENDAFNEIAVRAAEFLLNNCYSETGMCHYYDNESHVFGLLADNVNVIRCLTKAYHVTKNKFYLEKAESLAEFVIENLTDDYGFLDRISQDDIGLLKKKNRQFVENALATHVFLELYEMTKKQIYHDVARKSLAYFADKYNKFGVHAAQYALAVKVYLNIRN